MMTLGLQLDLCHAHCAFCADSDIRGLWREFRFDLSQEISNMDAFMQRIEGMALEAAGMLSKTGSS